MDNETLEMIIRSAFKAGIEWAETYSGWFIPEESQTEGKIQEVIKRFNEGRV